jgi:hypothetical protein
VGNMCLQLVVAKEVIFKLEQAQDHRSLSEEEIIPRNELKMKCLGIASLNRTIVRQCSRLLFLHERVASTHFFHLQAFHRGHKSFIEHIVIGDRLVIDEEQKAQVAFDYFDVILGAYQDHTHGLDFGLLVLPSISMLGLHRCFTEDEVWAIIKSLPTDKLPGLMASLPSFTRQHGLL